MRAFPEPILTSWATAHNPPWKPRITRGSLPPDGLGAVGKTGRARWRRHALKCPAGSLAGAQRERDRQGAAEGEGRGERCQRRDVVIKHRVATAGKVDQARTIMEDN